MLPLFETFKLYFKRLKQQLALRMSAEGEAIAKNDGLLSAYKGALAERLETNSSSAGRGRVKAAAACELGRGDDRSEKRSDMNFVNPWQEGDVVGAPFNVHSAIDHFASANFQT